MKVRMEIIQGHRRDKGKGFEIARSEIDNITVGRSARKSERYGEDYPHIQLSSEDLRLSRWHFMLQLRPPNCYICDMGSTNHTYVNDFKDYIKDTVELKDGDIIKAGRTYLKVSIAHKWLKEPYKYTCIKCGKGIEGLEGKPPEGIVAGDFICKGCKKKRPIHIWIPKEEKPEKRRECGIVHKKGVVKEEAVVGEKVPVNCFNCGKDVSGQGDKDALTEELSHDALYLCKDCAIAERKEKETIGHYILLSQIGIGGMGVVYKAWHMPTARIVAIKELLPDKLMDEKSLKVFHREISITRELIHPNIVRFYDSFTKKGKPYLITEYLPGGNAEDMLLKHKEPFTLKEACRIILESLEGLSFAHKRGIVHRDVKPQNILFAQDGRAKLSDMHLAKSFELAGQSGITSPGETGGTILYMAPEQILDFLFVKPPADVYSVGVCLYYFLTGKFPYHFPSSLDVLMGLAGLKKVKHPFTIVLEDDPIPILERKPDLPKPMAALIDRCLKKKPEERFRNGEELKKALGKFVRFVF